MAAIPTKVINVLKEYGLEPMQAEGDEASATSVMAAQAFGTTVGQIAKSLLFRDREHKYAMIVAAGDKKISNSKVKKLFGSKGSMTTPEETMQVTGFAVGGVCPFGIDTNEVPVYIDKSLKVYDHVYPACGTRNSAVKMDFDTLVKIAKGRTCDVTD